MKCEECLPLIEEYVDGELEGRLVERLDAHLSACAACAEEMTALRREQEVYASYRRDLEVTPAHWNVVRARIEQEKDAAPQSGSRPSLRERLGALFGKGLRPAFVAALVLAALAVTAAVIYLRSRESQGGLAQRQPARGQKQQPAPEHKETTPDKINGGVESVAQDEGHDQGGGGERPRVTVKDQAGTGTARKTLALARARRPENQTVERATPDDSARFEQAVAGSAVTGTLMNAPAAGGEFDFEMARHAERSELLLRSFRNVRPVTAAARALDVSFEKEQSRKLLYRNIALRRSAQERGDPSAVKLLNTLEPILLDIANLPGRARARDVESIERRMEKKEIVAALQVRTLLASN
ncbi:MAG TPA: zf-HC2 domain-containing protein [Pyrinomonadaceae bacterium]|jgi:hypothetical protein